MGETPLLRDERATRLVASRRKAGDVVGGSHVVKKPKLPRTPGVRCRQYSGAGGVPIHFLGRRMTPRGGGGAAQRGLMGSSAFIQAGFSREKTDLPVQQSTRV